jgi:hypothetical protein
LVKIGEESMSVFAIFSIRRAEGCDDGKALCKLSVFSAMFPISISFERLVERNLKGV